MQNLSSLTSEHTYSMQPVGMQSQVMGNEPHSETCASATELNLRSGETPSGKNQTVGVQPH